MNNLVDNRFNIDDKDINNIVKRAKLVVENDNNELLLAYSARNYFLLGGHIDGFESDYDCLIREIKEEAGIDINLVLNDPFLRITHITKDYPEIGINTSYQSTFYNIKHNLIPNPSNTNLTEEETLGKFKLVYIDKEQVQSVLKESLNNCTKRMVVQDTIDAINEYLKIN